MADYSLLREYEDYSYSDIVELLKEREDRIYDLELELDEYVQKISRLNKELENQE